MLIKKGSLMEVGTNITLIPVGIYKENNSNHFDKLSEVFSQINDDYDSFINRYLNESESENPKVEDLMGYVCPSVIDSGRMVGMAFIIDEEGNYKVGKTIEVLETIFATMITNQIDTLSFPLDMLESLNWDMDIINFITNYSDRLKIFAINDKIDVDKFNK